VKSGLSAVPVEAAYRAVKVANAQTRLESFILSGVGAVIVGDQNVFL
jgi:hypothetical protein